MYESANFAIKQLQRTKKAMGQPALSDFRPDGKDLVAVSSMLTTLDSTKGGVITASAALNFARGELDATWTDAHNKCVDVYAAMKSVYRNDSAALRAIRRVPKKDETARETLTRAEVTAAVWDSLPDMPGVTPATPFKLGTLTLAIFNGVIAELRAKIETCEGCDSVEQVAQGELSDLARKDSEFVSAAVAQGRAQYPENSVAREWIDTIPLEPSTVAPLQAEITAATSPVAGVVHLEYQATHATSYTIQHRLSSDVEFVTVAQNITEESWDFVGLPAGDHQYIVFGVNSRGDGPVSGIATVPVAAAAAA
jgi:hypothetical protein